MGPGWWQASDGWWYPPQHPSAPPAPAAFDYRRMWFWALIVLGAALILGISLTVIFDELIGKVIDTHTVVYTVTGSGTPTVTYSSLDNSFNGTTQVRNATLPWSVSTSAPAFFNAYSVTATLGSAGGALTCSLSVDGKQVSTRSASGPFASVVCSSGTS